MENKNLYLSAELKMADGEGFFEGYASTFGNVDSTDDIVMQGAFKESLMNREPKVLWQHDLKKPIGKLIEAREDMKGLHVKVKIATGTQLGKDAHELIKEGIINRLSIGFIIKEAEFDSETGIRKIIKVDLFEFSLVTIPANEEAKITGFKSLPNNERDFEKFLRANGYSRNVSKAITSRGIKGFRDILREADVETPEIVQREAGEKIATELSEVIKSLSQLHKTIKGENTHGEETN